MLRKQSLRILQQEKKEERVGYYYKKNLDDFQMDIGCNLEIWLDIGLGYIF